MVWKMKSWPIAEQMAMMKMWFRISGFSAK
jgi:hypothetical protein